MRTNRSTLLALLTLALGIGAAENIVQFYFGNELAQRWWTIFLGSHDPDPVLRELDELVRAAGTQFTLPRLKSMQAKGSSHWTNEPAAEAPPGRTRK